MIDRALRMEIEAAVLAEVERIGPRGLDKAAIVARFAGRGPARATLYRAVDRPLHSGRAGRHLADKVRKAAERRAKRTPNATAAAAEVAGGLAQKLPAALDLGNAVGGRTVDVIAELNRCIHAAELVIAHACTPDGGVRVAKVLLAGSEHLRRCIETSCRLQKAMHDVQQIDKFNAAVIRVIADVAREHPEAAELILRRTRALAVEWGGWRPDPTSTL